MKLFSEAEIQEGLLKIPGWDWVGNKIRKKYVVKNFAEAMKFVNQVGELAEGMNHHPDILIHGYKNVTLTLTTHDAGGLTVMDFELARKIESLGGLTALA